MSTTVQTTCPYCGVGCGVVASVDEQGKITIRGDTHHPANFGRLCSKGTALADTLDLQGRLLQPHIDGNPVDWDTALDNTAKRLSDIIRKHGKDSVAFYVSGQLLTEDYYVANKLMKGFIGTANIDTNSRLCMSSAVAAHKRAFGSDTVPCNYEDLELADLVILAGSNTAWCHPVLYQRIVAARKNRPGMKVVVIDPRRTASCDIADVYLAITPGSDASLFNGLLHYLSQHGMQDHNFVDTHTEGLQAALQAATTQSRDADILTARTGLNRVQLENFYRLFAETDKVVTVFSQGINQWSFGTDKVNAIINCHLFTGRIGKPGMGPFSFTGQPNAMGGREVGGLANQLAAHMDIENSQHRDWVKAFWQSPVIAEQAGYKAVELFDAIHAGKVKAVWIMATNPAVSLPNASKVREALQRCELVIVSDCMQHTDTTRYADVLFPATTWGEREGTVTNSERRISRQRAFLTAPGEARQDWWIISQLAQRLGFKQSFDYMSPADIFREHTALSAWMNHGQRDFNLEALKDISVEEYQHLQPVQWPVTYQASAGQPRMFADRKFYTATGRAQFVPVDYHQPANSLTESYPLTLNTGRVRDQWHTMTRTGKSARLSGHISEAFVEIHPDDAITAGIEANDLVKLSSSKAEVIVRARISDAQQPGSVFVPIHWNDQYASKAIINALISPCVDPYSGQPEFKHSPVQLARYQPAWHGFILSRRRLNISHASYWSCTRGDSLWRYEIAGEESPRNWGNAARALLCQSADTIEWVEYFDQAKHRYRAARIEDQQLESCVFIGPTKQLPERDWLASLFHKATLEKDERVSLLSGKPRHAEKDQGRIVCACHYVGINVIIDAIQGQGLVTVEEIGQALRAGTNCGSCIPELREILSSHPAKVAAGSVS